jgi:gliding motility-associated-like protein
MFRFLNLLAFICFAFYAGAQTCTIISSATVCKEELMSFDVTSSSTIASASWDMGDGTSSTQINFSHKYSTKGVKNVKVTLQLIGGGSCITTKQITVYELPVFKVTLKKDNNYCNWKNEVCFVDSSTGGDSGVKIKKRLVLWDDGSQSLANNPSLGSTECHHYSNPGTYKVTIELTNDKDCKLQVIVNVTIIKDVVPVISVFAVDNEMAKYCDSALTHFYDRTLTDTNTITGRIYDWGDGSPKISTKSRHVTHFYKKGGNYKVSLTYTQTNGCSTTKDTIIEVNTFGVNFNITNNGDKKCLGNLFRFTQKDALSGAWYGWYINDMLVDYDYDMKIFDISPNLGKSKISLQVINYGCNKTFKYDTIEVIGFISGVKVYNENQCDNKDTVYFIASAQQYGIGKLNYFWDLDDSKSPQCTTSIVSGLNKNSNCNYSTDSFVKHKYVDAICRTFRLRVSEPTSGCNPETHEGKINTLKPDTIRFDYSADRFCIGDKEEYGIRFNHNLCDIIKIQSNIDSALGKDRFSNKYIFAYVYTKTANKDGWVTVGFTTKFGSGKIYTGFNELKDFYYDSSRICYDTIWKHNWYKLTPEPKTDFQLNLKCMNLPTQIIVIDSIQKDIKYTTWSWGDNTPSDTIFQAKGDSSISSPTHVYKKSGIYTIRFKLENENKCISQFRRRFVLGFINQLELDTIICPGNSVLLNDSFCYFDTSSVTGDIIYSTNYWLDAKRKKAGKELFYWDFDDGRGFATDTSGPVIAFPKSGNYRIRLAAKDSNECWDTLIRNVNVGGAHAGIKHISKRIICDGIVQLYDSSYSDYKSPIDSITKYYWDFGDGGNPSYLANPFHNYTSFGNYTIFQRVESSRGCSDTAYIKIVIEGPVAKFDIVSDTIGCAPVTAEFKNNSIKTRDFIWYFGDPLKTKLFTNRDTNVRFTYTKPGIYYIYLFGSDSVVNPNAGNAIYYCKTFFPDTNLANHPIRRIVVLPNPKADFNVNPIQCLGQPITLTDQSDTLYKSFKWTITQIDSFETSSKTGILRTRDTGTFLVKFTPHYIPNPIFKTGCYDTVIKSIRITDVKADFSILKDSSGCPTYTFINQTKNYKTIKWNLNDEGAGDAKNIKTDNKFTYQYSKKGDFGPCLFVENSEGCLDTLCKNLSVNVTKKLIIPNVFTPGNNDDLNDVFDIVTEGVEEYELTIINRWGQVIYKTDIDGVGDDGHNWRGRPNVVSDLYPEGTYFYIFKYKFACEDKSETVQGTITLITPKN